MATRIFDLLNTFQPLYEAGVDCPVFAFQNSPDGSGAIIPTELVYCLRDRPVRLGCFRVCGEGMIPTTNGQNVAVTFVVFFRNDDLIVTRFCEAAVSSATSLLNPIPGIKPESLWLSYLFKEAPEFMKHCEDHAVMEDPIGASIHALNRLAKLNAGEEPGQADGVWKMSARELSDDSEKRKNTSGETKVAETTQVPSETAPSTPQPAQKKAYTSYECAVSHLGCDSKLTCKEAFYWLRENGFSDDDILAFPILADYTIPRSLESWSRSVRAVRKHLKAQKNSPTHARPHGTSIAKASELELPSP